MPVRVVDRPKPGFWDRTYISVVLEGLFVTFRHIFRKKVTVQFPEEQLTFADGYRGYPRLVLEEDNLPKCVACKLCEVVCPSSAITIVIGEYEDPNKRERIPARFVIDMGRCIVCGLCQEACPVDAIVMSDVHIMSSGSRESLIFTKTTLLDDYKGLEKMRE